MAVPGWALLDFCSILGEIGKASHVPAIGQRASIRHVQLLFQLSSYDQFEEDIHQRINQGCEIVSLHIEKIFCSHKLGHKLTHNESQPQNLGFNFCNKKSNIQFMAACPRSH